MIFNILNFSQNNQNSQPYYFFYIPIQNPTQIISNFTQNQTQINTQSYFEFQELLLKELNKKHSESYIKMWTQEEDNKLLTLGRTCQDWRQLSREFHGKSTKVCRRRFWKLINKQKQWPSQKEHEIKYLRQVERKSWVEIEMILKAQFGDQSTYKAKKIRERYKNYLEMKVTRQKWSLNQDIELWRRVSTMGKSWKDIAVFFPERSSLQIRNRYYKFLEPILKRLEERAGQEDLQMIQ